MDPFSAISSVFQIAGVLIAYITDFRNAPKELNDCAIEISHLTLLFTQIRLRAAYCDDTDRKFGDVWQTLVNDYEDDGPIQQYACTLNELHKMLPKPGNKSSAFSHRIRYHFNHQQISRILARLQRTTSIFQLALEMDVS
ncbi:hypothetical protein P152DRAFT_183946 [Eremomyces bilateralis CBS 781.70]|uniref:Fungal N-terminal domain-containing protein n=1 Tax=Eremomyces bilateralis CBS 781.70 TaxID=1392243 RepID=A0A6G1GBG6_9PEZI|nr:uncharacterized protein P152DRAFT_183946 [Eremomyces bilateralis CBS 781.70]KAF1815393.1 hypothetical protein P152DRAFT_183946 [Eremomyces bilateralis CBS 781.70]